MAIESRTPSHSAIPTAETGLGPQSRRAAGRSFPDEEVFSEEEDDLIEDAQERARRLAAAGARYAQTAWDSGRQAIQDSSRQARRWARRHPAQLWTAVGALGLLAIWMAYRPTRSDRTEY
jgi:hypothetical protein